MFLVSWKKLVVHAMIFSLLLTLNIGNTYAQTSAVPEGYTDCIDDGYSKKYCEAKHDLPMSFTTQSADSLEEIQQMIADGYSLTDLEVQFAESSKKLLQEFDLERIGYDQWGDRLSRIAEKAKKSIFGIAQETPVSRINDYFSVATELHNVSSIKQVEGSDDRNQFLISFSSSADLSNIMQDLHAHPDVMAVKAVKPGFVVQQLTPLCDNMMLDLGETDVDCGGDCRPCSSDQHCNVDSDCLSDTCILPEAEDEEEEETDFVTQSVNVQDDGIELSPESMKEMIDDQQTEEYQAPSWWKVLVDRIADWIKSLLGWMGVLPQYGSQVALEWEPGKSEVLQKSLFETAQVVPQLGEGTCRDPSETPNCGDGFCNAMALENETNCPQDCAATCTYLCAIPNTKIACDLASSADNTDCGGNGCYGVCGISKEVCFSHDHCGENDLCMPIQENSFPQEPCSDGLPFNQTEITFLEDQTVATVENMLEYEYTSSQGNQIWHVTVPTGAVATRLNAQSLEQVTLGFYDNKQLPLPVDSLDTLVGHLQWGALNTHVAFSQPVEIVMQVPEYYNGKMLGVQGIHYLDDAPGYSSITNENGACDGEGRAISSANVFIVQNNEIRFYTCSASTYVITYVGGANRQNFVDNGEIEKTVAFNAVSQVAPILTVRVDVRFQSIDSEDPFNFGMDNVYANEVYMKLKSPAGTEVILLQPGTYDEGYAPAVDVKFSDQATSLPSGLPVGGTFLPAQALSAFVGEDPTGAWTFTLGDNSPGDGVILHSYAIEINDASSVGSGTNAICGNGVCEPGENSSNCPQDCSSNTNNMCHYLCEGGSTTDICITPSPSSPQCNGAGCYGSCTTTMNKCYTDADCANGDTCDPVNVTLLPATSPVVVIPNCPMGSGGGSNYCGGYCALSTGIISTTPTGANMVVCDQISAAHPTCGGEPCYGRCDMTMTRCITDANCPSGESCVEFDVSNDQLNTCPGQTGTGGCTYLCIAGLTPGPIASPISGQQFPLSPTCTVPNQFGSPECPSGEPCVGRCSVTFNKCTVDSHCPMGEQCVPFDLSNNTPAPGSLSQCQGGSGNVCEYMTYLVSGAIEIDSLGDAVWKYRLYDTGGNLVEQQTNQMTQIGYIPTCAETIDILAQLIAGNKVLLSNDLIQMQCNVYNTGVSLEAGGKITLSTGNCCGNGHVDPGEDCGEPTLMCGSNQVCKSCKCESGTTTAGTTTAGTTTAGTTTAGTTTAGTTTAGTTTAGTTTAGTTTAGTTTAGTTTAGTTTAGTTTAGTTTAGTTTAGTTTAGTTTAGSTTAGTTTAGCVPTSLEKNYCDDGKDNDCDGKIDCADSECINQAICGGGGGSCIPTGPEYDGYCLDGVDNDCDGKIDCADSECGNEPICDSGGGGGGNGGGGGGGSSAICGNGRIERSGNEECDDGNIANGDGCNRNCQIELGYQCSGTPSRCGSIECLGHANWYDQDNIYGRCCAGLEIQIFEVDNKDVAICYDPNIDEPLCLSSENPEGWYLKERATDQISLVYQTTCSESYNDYADELAQVLAQQIVYCQFNDENYEAVDFADIERSRERSAILAMKHYCIVKGRGPELVAYSPQGRVSRAEFIKMLYKTYAINQQIAIQPEAQKYAGETHYTDIAKSHWSAQYVAGAHEQGWLTPLESSGPLKGFIYPNKSITRQDIVDVLDWVDDGAALEPATIEKILGDAEYPNRAAVAELITQIFLQKFLDYFYMQDNNRLYYEELLKKLEGKSYTQQYEEILAQIEKWQEAEQEHGTYEEEGLYPFWITSFLKKLVKGTSKAE